MGLKQILCRLRVWLMGVGRSRITTAPHSRMIYDVRGILAM